MRLLVDARAIADTNHGGVNRVSRALVEAYADRFPEDEIVLATTGCSVPVGAGFKPAPTPNCRHIHLKLPNKLWSLLSFLNLVSLDREIEKRVGKIDAMFLPNLGFTGRITTCLAGRQVRPYVLLLHDLSFLIEPRWFSRKMRWWHRAVRAEEMIRNATHLLAVSETTKKDTVRLLGIPAERISVIPIGPTLSCHPEAPAKDLSGTPKQTGPSFVGLTQDDRKKRFILILGSNDPRKNAQTAIVAVRELKKENDFGDLELVIVGAGSPRPPVDGPGRGDRAPTWIHHINHPSDPELASLYKNAAAFLYPSWYEGYGLPLHEAAAFGTPCIASTAGALPETAPTGTVFADPAKPHHWVEALREVLTNPIRTKTDTTASKWIEAAEALRNSTSH